MPRVGQPSDARRGAPGVAARSVAVASAGTGELISMSARPSLAAAPAIKSEMEQETSNNETLKKNKLFLCFVRYFLLASLCFI
jgi:hypothetical protein